MNHEDFKAGVVAKCLAMPGVVAYCEREGFQVKALQIVQFHDTREDLPWFRRDVETVGYIAAVCSCGAPIDGAGVLASVREEFGPEAAVLWV